MLVGVVIAVVGAVAFVVAYMLPPTRFPGVENCWRYAIMKK